MIMTFPVQISFQGLDHSEALANHISTAAEKLGEVYDRIERCEIVVESPHRHSPRTPQYHVRVRLHVPGPDVIVDRDSGPEESHDDPYLAVREALRVTRRRLEHHVARLRGDLRPRGPAR